jgi:hypothetical protein
MAVLDRLLQFLIAIVAGATLPHAPGTDAAFAISACAGADGFDMGDHTNDKEYHHFTLDQWAALRAIATSGVIEQALRIAQAWEDQYEEDTDTIISILEAIDGGE